MSRFQYDMRRGRRFGFTAVGVYVTLLVLGFLSVGLWHALINPERENWENGEYAPPIPLTIYSQSAIDAFQCIATECGQTADAQAFLVSLAPQLVYQSDGIGPGTDNGNGTRTVTTATLEEDTWVQVADAVVLDGVVDAATASAAEQTVQEDRTVYQVAGPDGTRWTVAARFEFAGSPDDPDNVTLTEITRTRTP